MSLDSESVNPRRSVPRDDIEIEIVRNFILAERQDRLLFLQRRRRKEFVSAFHTEKFLDLDLAIPLKFSAVAANDAFALMRRLGASDECYVVSAQTDLDAQALPLMDALRQCVGFSIETILCSPGTGVGYYEGGGYANRYVLLQKDRAIGEAFK